LLYRTKGTSSNLHFLRVLFSYGVGIITIKPIGPEKISLLSLFEQNLSLELGWNSIHGLSSPSPRYRKLNAGPSMESAADGVLVARQAGR